MFASFFKKSKHDGKREKSSKRFSRKKNRSGAGKAVDETYNTGNGTSHSRSSVSVYFTDDSASVPDRMSVSSASSASSASNGFGVEEKNANMDAWSLAITPREPRAGRTSYSSKAGMVALMKGNKKSKAATQLYGPYPSQVPIPYLSDDGTTPSAEALDGAKSFLDLEGICDYRDKGTPDEWIPRDGRLIRLTGRHPFNCEPPLSLLKQYRFITPTSLHYTRNHGATPKLTWEDHTLVIGGHVWKPLEIHMDELLSLGKPREIPVTVTCAGNRRKEQNMMRQTIGFGWGPCATSTSVYKGIMLRDVLLAAGVTEKNMAGMHVEFLGYEDLPNKIGPGPFKDEPWGDKVKFGASVPLSRAMNKAFDIMIAYEQNGMRLTPDRGYPIRLICPGYVAARNIKWLKEINIIPHETRNHYFYHDNRILPPHVLSMEEAMAGDWFYKPEYVYDEHNINSVIASPGHGDRISLVDGIGKTYKISGYAYSGGGRHVTRVDLSFDGGETWVLATLDRKEKPTDYNMSWCWLWWDYEVPIQTFINATEIKCRAWDSSNNRQPDQPIWSLMGYGNNHHYKVKRKLILDKEDVFFEFQHPVEPGQISGGWMEQIEDKPVSAGFGKLIQSILEESKKSKDFKKETVERKSNAPVFTMDEVRKHNKEDDCWIVVHDRVYNATDYLSLHPGGKDSILLFAGEDCTDDFDAIHSDNAAELLEKYYIGDVGETSQPEAVVETPAVVVESKVAPRIEIQEEKKEDEPIVQREEALIALDPKKKSRFLLQKKTVLSSDSFLLDFALPSQEHISGIPTGKHVFIYAKVNGKTVMRAYTPISAYDDKGSLKFVIKAYRSCKAFPEGGIMSQYLDSVPIGDFVDFRGPLGEIEYLSNGNFTFDGIKHNARRINMIAGGTGITPCFQVAAEILRSASDNTRVSLIFAARTEADLLLKDQLDEWARKFGSWFSVHYVLSRGESETRSCSKGYVTKDMFSVHLFDASPDVFNFMCGPERMINESCVPHLTGLGHSKSNIIEF